MTCSVLLPVIAGKIKIFFVDVEELLHLGAAQSL
jgi:hypothetical protein